MNQIRFILEQAKLAHENEQAGLQEFLIGITGKATVTQKIQPAKVGSARGIAESRQSGGIHTIHAYAETA